MAKAKKKTKQREKKAAATRTKWKIARVYFYDLISEFLCLLSTFGWVCACERVYMCGLLSTFRLIQTGDLSFYNLFFHFDSFCCVVVLFHRHLNILRWYFVVAVSLCCYTWLAIILLFWCCLRSMPKDYGEVFIFISFWHHCMLTRDDNKDSFASTIFTSLSHSQNSQKRPRCHSLEMLLPNQIYRKETIPPKDTSIT